MDKEKIKELLAAPFSYNEIRWRIGATFSKGGKDRAIAVPYVTRLAVQDRLDEVFGISGWKNEFQKWSDDSQLCGISFRLDDNAEWITKWDGAGNTDIEGTKGGLSDSFKRAAILLGIGRYLNKMNTVYVDVDVKNVENGKKHYSISSTEIEKKLPRLYQDEINRLFGTSNQNDAPNLSNENTELCSNKHLINALEQIINMKKVDINSILKNYKVESLDHLTAEQISNALRRLSITQIA